MLIKKNCLFCMQVALLVIMICSSAFAEFEPPSAGGRAPGMGGAFVTCTGIDALFYNPAGLADLQKTTLMFNSVDLYGLGTTEQFFAVGTNWHKLGIGATYQSLFDQELEYKLQMLQVSVAKSLKPSLIIGASMRTGRLASLGGWGKAIMGDFGLIWQAFPTAKVAISAQNMLASANYEIGFDERPPLCITTGLSLSLPGQTQLAINVPLKEKGTDLQLGLEKWYSEQLGVRLGMSEGRWTAGLSLKHNGILLDYAYLAHNMGDTHRIALKVELGGGGK